MCWTLAAAVFLIAITPLGGPRAVGLPTAGQLATKSTTYLVVTVLLVLPAVFGRTPADDGVFANRPMRWYGQISYSVFLLHLTVLVEAHRLLGNGLFSGSTFQLAVLTFCGTLPLAALSYRLVERPFMSLRYPPGGRWRPGVRSPLRSTRAGRAGAGAARDTRRLRSRSAQPEQSAPAVTVASAMRQPICTAARPPGSAARPVSPRDRHPLSR